MKLAAQVGACVPLLLLSGCHTARPPSEVTWVHGPALIFDPEPARPDAGAFAFRDPALAAEVRVDQGAYYTELIYDRQGTYSRDVDYFTRRVWTLRDGAGRLAD